MDSLNDGIMTFGSGKRPHESELVVWDGFDQLEKEAAVQFFSEKTWQDVLSHLQGLKDDPLFGAAYFLEEWTVLTSEPLGYYARAYLEYLRETLESVEPDEEFVFFFLGALNQMSHRLSQFDTVQKEILSSLVQHIMQKASTSHTFEYFSDDIKHEASKFLGDNASNDS